MNLKLYIIIFFFTTHARATFLEKLASQTPITKTLLGLAGILPLAHAGFIQYHLRKQHGSKTECDTYSCHHLSNIPYINIIFYINMPIVKLINTVFKTEHNDTCILYKSGYTIIDNYYTKKCNTHKNLFSFLGIMDSTCYLFLIYKLIGIARQS
jgi:hypothetical protein